MVERTYIAIDLKSFYASSECVELGFDPLRTHLVVADESRTDKTICLAVSPSLKAYGLPGRARLFEVREKLRQINAERQLRAPGHRFRGTSYYADELEADPSLAVDVYIAKPRMSHYLNASGKIYGIYLRYASADDIHVYSIDEVFMDATRYLHAYGKTPHELARDIVRAIYNETGITATAGIGTNLYLAKVAMDIVAKHIPADAEGVRIAQLDEMSYRRLLWGHRPLTDFWRVGRGYAKKLESHGLMTMGDIARCSLGRASDYYNEELLYRLFGKNAELLIDHAWGWEPCTIPAIKAYRPSENSLSSGQVLSCPYEAAKARLVLREMADQLSLELVEKGLVTDQVVLTVGYDIENLTAPARRAAYSGPVEQDRYGRRVPKAAHGAQKLDAPSSSTRRIMEAASALFDRIVDGALLVRRMYLVAAHIVPEDEAQPEEMEQLDLFTDLATEDARREAEQAALAREKKLQETTLAIKKKFGKNAILKGMSLEEGATARERNASIGGHKA